MANVSDEMYPGRVIFTTYAGTQIDIQPVSPRLIQLVRATCPEPDVPTYTVHTAAGYDEELPHDETTLEVPNDLEQSKKNREIWINYELKRDQARNEMTAKVTRLYLLKGVLSNPPEDGFWIKEQQKYGIVVPTDPDELKIHWLNTEVLTHYEDLSNLITTFMGMAGAREDTLEAIRKSFRNTVQRIVTRVSTDSKESLEIQ